MAGARLSRPVSAEEAGQRLDDALSQLNLSPTAGQREQLLGHLALLAKWNAVYNLTAIRDPGQMLAQHLFDCLAVLPALRDPQLAGRDHLADGAVVLDVGSGGGLPGVVLAICAPGVQVHCVDAVAKKAAFVRQVRAELGLTNLHAHHARVEQLRIDRNVTDGLPEAGTVPPVTLAVSRAFASLADFVRLTRDLLAPDGVWAAMKGAMPEDELRELPVGVHLLAAITLGVPQLDARRHLLLLQGRPA
jgi:16S rRNA (guanine527-N7)-methyltransferase